MRRVLIIGLDGADFRLIDPWVKAGQLPTLARLMTDGARCTLRSTIRPESSLAWASFSTGVNPGKHSLFGFVRVEPGTYRPRVLTAHDIQMPSFWHLASEAGKRVIVLNVPMTYPPQAVNGSLVAGMPAPITAQHFTYPDDLAHELNTATGGYVIDVEASMTVRQQLIAQSQTCVEQRLKAIHYLSCKDDWDMFVAVFTEPDRLQHFFWADQQDDHPLRPARPQPEVLLSLYRQIDTGLAQILADAGQDTLVLLVSDHGFNACARKFYVNTWLQQAGFLALNPDLTLPSVATKLMTSLKRVAVLRRLKRHVPGLRERSIIQDAQQDSLVQSIDWSATRAFFSPESGIRINLRGREPAGIVEHGREYNHVRQQLRDQLPRVIDSATGQQAIESVYYREELYDGPYVELAPDLIIEPPRDSARASHNLLLGSIAPDRSRQPFGSSAPYTANHTLHGIFIAYGLDVRRGTRLTEAAIADIAPTVLAYLGVPVPAHMDGRVLSEIIGREAVPALPPVTDWANESSAADSLIYAPGEEEEVMRRLRDLGYLG